VLVDDVGIRTWPVPHGGAFGWPGAVSRLRARPWRVAGAATFVALASEQLKRLHPERIVAHWIVPCAHPIASAYRSAGETEAVAHGADVRLLLALPMPLRVRLMEHVLATTTSIRFAARASYDALSSMLPERQREALAQRVRVRPAHLSVPDISSAAQEVKAAAGPRPLAVAVSRLVASKRVDLAIEAINRLRPQISLGVVGEGPDRARLLRLPGAAGVRFEGLLPRDRALAWIAAADVLVHPSVAEAAPTVIREARLFGTPVVACDSGDVSRWAETDPGIVVVAPEAGAIAAAIDRVALGAR
jgi:glycosyltransferase involved in cell wall biosynthesis